MTRVDQNPEVTVFGEYSPEDHLTVASFVWPIANTQDTYTIDINSGLSLELDKHFPVRLSRIALYNYAPDSAQLLSKITAPELAEALLTGPNLGAFIMSLSVNRKNRLAIAHLQINSPSTPPRMRRAIAAMLRANDYNLTDPHAWTLTASGGDASSWPLAA